MNRKLKYILFAAVFAGGYCSLSLELAVMRQLSGFVGSTAVTASVIIGVILAFMSFGYWRGSVVSVRKNRLRQHLAPDFILIALMTAFASSYILIDVYFMAMNAVGIRSNVAHKWLSMSDMYLMTMILKTSFLCVAAFTFLFPRSINLMLMGHLYLNKM